MSSEHPRGQSNSTTCPADHPTAAVSPQCGHASQLTRSLPIRRPPAVWGLQAHVRCGDVVLESITEQPVAHRLCHWSERLLALQGVEKLELAIVGVLRDWAATRPIRACDTPDGPCFLLVLGEPASS